MNTCGTTCSDSFSHNTEWVTYEAMSFMKDALSTNTSFFAYVNPSPPHGSDSRYSLRDVDSDSYGPYYCTASPNGTLTDSWTQTCGTSMGTAADFSDVCQTCNFKSRTEIWQDAADTSGINKKSTVAGVSWVDQSIGAIYDFLSENGVLDDTIIIVLSDNGYAKSTLYEWGVRTMMHVRFPNGNISPSTVVDEPVTNLDIVPSILDFIGAQGMFCTRFLLEHH